MTAPTTFGGYIEAYAMLPGVTQAMVTEFVATAMDADASAYEASAVLYAAARELADTGTLDPATYAALAAIGHDDIPWFVIACAPTQMRAMREIGLWMWGAIEGASEPLHRGLTVTAAACRKAVRRGN